MPGGAGGEAGGDDPEPGSLGSGAGAPSSAFGAVGEGTAEVGDAGREGSAPDQVQQGFPAGCSLLEEIPERLSVLSVASGALPGAFPSLSSYPRVLFAGGPARVWGARVA